MVATSPPATATINARNWIHAPTNTPNRLGSSRLPSAPLAKNPTNRNSPANAPTTGTHRHDQDYETWRDRRDFDSGKYLDRKPQSRDKKSGNRQLAGRGQRIWAFHRVSPIRSGERSCVSRNLSSASVIPSP